MNSERLQWIHNPLRSSRKYRKHDQWASLTETAPICAEDKLFVVVTSTMHLEENCLYVPLAWSNSCVTCTRKQPVCLPLVAGPVRSMSMPLWTDILFEVLHVPLKHLKQHQYRCAWLKKYLQNGWSAYTITLIKMRNAFSRKYFKVLPKCLYILAVLQPRPVRCSPGFHREGKQGRLPVSALLCSWEPLG